jgi:hypothetical protein
VWEARSLCLKRFFQHPCLLVNDQRPCAALVGEQRNCSKTTCKTICCVGTPEDLEAESGQVQPLPSHKFTGFTIPDFAAAAVLGPFSCGTRHLFAAGANAHLHSGNHGPWQLPQCILSYMCDEKMMCTAVQRVVCQSCLLYLVSTLGCVLRRLHAYVQRILHAGWEAH